MCHQSTITAPEWPAYRVLGAADAELVKRICMGVYLNAGYRIKNFPSIREFAEVIDGLKVSAGSLLTLDVVDYNGTEHTLYLEIKSECEQGRTR